MKVRLVFNDWRYNDGRSVYNSEEGLTLSSGDFHSGTTFNASLELDEEQAAELKTALEDGYTPVFELVK